MSNVVDFMVFKKKEEVAPPFKVILEAKDVFLIEDIRSRQEDG